MVGSLQTERDAHADGYKDRYCIPAIAALVRGSEVSRAPCLSYWTTNMFDSVIFVGKFIACNCIHQSLII